MSDPRFVPRDYADEWDGFGKVWDINWMSNPRNELDRTRIAAALIQHRFSYVIRRKAKVKHGSVSAYAKDVGTPYDHLSKVLRGEAILRLEVIAQAERHLGGIQEEVARMSGHLADHTQPALIQNELEQQ
ncbi:hypothetical protein C6I20_14415 [Aeromicrobium sp. A1-2]|uniref:hypothetical protein n=1 Tax=Aeromicrobium sp. A1-2 TaxID=2107713 RepID=UPI000E4741DE|nr:hypothetical protein [Aeromicrobium sp. A1-2]AXT86256.1 hypothetical protein C6I20_14415 [Aeromicrobium sp. A1-2]